MSDINEKSGFAFTFQPVTKLFEEQVRLHPEKCAVASGEESFTYVELNDRAKTHGGKFKDFNEYLDAMDVWNEYMELLADKYGSVEIVEVGAKEGSITEFVPRNPQL